MPKGGEPMSNEDILIVEVLFGGVMLILAVTVVVDAIMKRFEE
jgi:hypothetical protein